MVDPLFPHGLHPFCMAELLNHCKAVGEFGARIQIIQPELINIEKTRDIRVLDG